MSGSLPSDVGDAGPAGPTALALLEHRAWVRSLARRLLADENSVDDVEQETWTAALRSGPDEPRALRSWLGSVASRFALQRLRGERRRARREEAVAGAPRLARPTADVVAEADAHGHVVQAVLALREPYRTTVILRYFEALPVADVATRMEVPVETVRTRLRRAHEVLRSALVREHGRPVAALLGPVGAAALSDLPVTPAAPSPPITLGLGASLAGAAGVAGAVVGAVALGAWALSEDGGGARGPVAAAVPQDGGGGGAGGGQGGGGPGQRGEDGSPRSRADAPPAVPPAAPGADPWIAYDLADGRPLPQFSLRIRTAEGESVVVTDGAGRVDADRATVLAVSPGDSATWNLAVPRNGAVRDEPSLWFWREREVRGSVAARDAAKQVPSGAVEVWWTVPFASADPRETGRGASWLARRDLPTRRIRVDAAVDSGGRFTGRVPAFRGGWLTVTADGFAPDARPVAFGDDPLPELRFELGDTVRVIGRIRREDGEPLVRGSVQVDASVLVSGEDDAARFQALRPRGGVGMTGGAHGRSVCVSESVTTDVRGIFRADLAPLAPGSVTVLHFRAPGHLECRTVLGALGEPIEPIEWVLRPSDERVEFRIGGVPVARTGLGLQVADGRENGFSLVTHEDGRADAGWLQRGRWYRVTCARPGAEETDPINGCFLWDGQPTIDLDTLPDQPPRTR